jgi:hypothetical protein
MSVHVDTRIPTHSATQVARPWAGTLHLSFGDRLQLTLSLCCALTGTPLGFTMAVVVLGMLAARRSARRAVDRSVAVRRGVLAPAQHAGPLHAAGRPRQPAARP